jgi:hypothetical protein
VTRTCFKCGEPGEIHEQSKHAPICVRCWKPVPSKTSGRPRNELVIVTLEAAQQSEA